MHKLQDIYFSVNLLFCFLLFFALGCSPKPTTSPADAALVVDELTSKFGVADQHVTGAYFNYVTNRLSDALTRVGQKPLRLEVIILNVREPLAFCPGPASGGQATLVLSRGLVRRLQVEAELAFVIAHEIGHLVLNHHSQGSNLGVPSYRREFEDEADRFGVGLLAGAGYDPHFASLALLHAYEQGEPSDPLYPDLGARIATLREEVADSKWKPPGTIDRRDFQRLRRILS